MSGREREREKERLTFVVSSQTELEFHVAFRWSNLLVYSMQTEATHFNCFNMYQLCTLSLCLYHYRSSVFSNNRYFPSHFPCLNTPILWSLLQSQDQVAHGYSSQFIYIMKGEIRKFETTPYLSIGII